MNDDDLVGTDLQEIKVWLNRNFRNWHEQGPKLVAEFRALAKKTLEKDVDSVKLEGLVRAIDKHFEELCLRFSYHFVSNRSMDPETRFERFVKIFMAVCRRDNIKI